MAQPDEFDLLGGILEGMDATHGPVEGSVDAEALLDASLLQNEETAATVEPSASSEPAGTTPPPSEPSQMDQLTAAITTLTRSFQVLQAEHRDMVATMQQPKPYTGKGKGVGKKSGKKSSTSHSEQPKQSQKTSDTPSTVATATARATASCTMTNQETPKPQIPAGNRNLDNYKIPKRSQSQNKRAVENDKLPPPKRQRAGPSYDLNERDSDLDYSEGELSDIDYDIDFEDNETIEDRIEQLLQSPPKSKFVFTPQGQNQPTPSTSAGNPAAGLGRAVVMTSPVDIEQGELPPEQLDMRLAEIASELSTDDDVGPDVTGQLASIYVWSTG